jgi:hypothetical protein
VDCTEKPELISEGPSIKIPDCPHISCVVREVFAKDRSLIKAVPLSRNPGSPGTKALVTPETVITTEAETHAAGFLLLLALQDEPEFSVTITPPECRSINSQQHKHGFGVHVVPTPLNTFSPPWH